MHVYRLYRGDSEPSWSLAMKILKVGKFCLRDLQESFGQAGVKLFPSDREGVMRIKTIMGGKHFTEVYKMQLLNKWSVLGLITMYHCTDTKGNPDPLHEWWVEVSEEVQ